MNKNEALLKLSTMLMDARIKPMLDKAITMSLDNPKPIKYRPELDNDDYLIWQCKQQGKSIQIINNRL